MYFKYVFQILVFEIGLLPSTVSGRLLAGFLASFIAVLIADTGFRPTEPHAGVHRVLPDVRCQHSIMPNTHRRRRRDETVLSRRVGFVYWA